MCTTRQQCLNLADQVGARFSHYEWDGKRVRLYGVYVIQDPPGTLTLDQGSSLDWPGWVSQAVHQIPAGRSAQIIPGIDDLAPYAIMDNGEEYLVDVPV